MAGTIVADTLQDGAGNSTSMDNAIYGSAKAWVRWTYTASTLTIQKNYNVSSITRTASGFYVVNFTNSLADANYSVSGSSSSPSGSSSPTGALQMFGNSGGNVTPLTNQFCVSAINGGATANPDPLYVSLAVFD